MNKKELHLLILCLISFFSSTDQLYANEKIRERDLYRIGKQAMESDDYYTAIESFRMAIILNPSYADARLSMAEALYLLGEYSEAYKEITAAKRYTFQDKRRIIIEARILTALARYDEAIALYTDLLTRRPYDSEVNQGLGEVYAIQGRRDLADRAYNRSLEYSPGNLRVLLQLIILHDNAREKTQGENILTEALRLYPNDLHLRIQAAEHHALYDEWDEVAEHLDHARAMLQGPHDGRYRRISILNASMALRRGDPAAALAHLESIPGDEDSELLFLKARIYRDLGQESTAQGFLRLLLRQNPDDEVTRIFREAPLVQAIDGLMEFRTDAASWHINKGKRLEESYYYRQALVSYQWARKIDSTNVEHWLKYANLIRLMGFPGKYRDELYAITVELQNDSERQSSVQKYLNLLEHSEISSLAGDWGIDDPWNFPPSDWKVGVFIILEKQLFHNHEGAGMAVASHAANLLDARSEISVVNLDGGIRPGVREVSSYTEAFRTARETVDYFILLNFAETDRSFSAAATVYLGRTGEVVTQVTQLRTGQEKVKDSLNLLVQDVSSFIPMKISILDVQGDTLLLNKGRWQGIEKDASLVVLRKGAARPAVTEEGIDYPVSDYLGSVNITDISEALSEGKFIRNGEFDFISTGDEVFFLDIPEYPENTTAPDPAFRSRLLSVP